jgi:hypothetical protein
MMKTPLKQEFEPKNSLINKVTIELSTSSVLYCGDTRGALRQNIVEVDSGTSSQLADVWRRLGELKKAHKVSFKQEIEQG